MRILFDSKKLYHKSPFGSIREHEPCTVRIDIPVSCKATLVLLKIFREDGFSMSVPLTKDNGTELYNSYSGELSLYSRGLYFYYFRIKTENEEFDLYKQGDTTNMEAGDLWQLTCFDKDYDVPDSFKGKVMYQIFPDRFAKSGECDTKNKLTPFVMHTAFDELPVFTPDANGQILNNDFYGGNLRGITEKLPYLADMGVGIIYLNPIFFAYSNHRYDTADYKRIDDLLGNEDDLKELCDTAHKHGMKIILDGVFSHTGSNSIYFDKNNVFKNGAYSNPLSPYRQWYQFESYPDKYTSWWGIDTLPCVNELEKSYLDYVIFSRDSVISHWMMLGIDGFRLDVADELPDEFISKFKQKMKEINPDSLLIGEVWEDASNKISYGQRRKYFSDSELDSVMNYPFRAAIFDFIRQNIKAEEFEKLIMTIVENYPAPVLSCVMNSLSTHDTPRVLNELSGVAMPPTKSARANFTLTDEALERALANEMGAVFLQFLLPGNPCIYYGDEIAMQGCEDPLNRAFFKWSDVDFYLRDFYKSLSKLKNESEPIRLGSIEFICAEGDRLAFVRKHLDEQITAEISLGEKIPHRTDALFYFSKLNVSAVIYKK